MNKIRCVSAHKVDRASTICAELFSKIGQSQSLGHLCIVDAKVFAVTAVTCPLLPVPDERGNRTYAVIAIELQTRGLGYGMGTGSAILVSRRSGNRKSNQDGCAGSVRRSYTHGRCESHE